MWSDRKIMLQILLLQILFNQIELKIFLEYILSHPSITQLARFQYIYAIYPPPDLVRFIYLLITNN